MPQTAFDESPLVLVDGTPLRKDSKGVGRYTYHLCDQLDQKLPKNWRIIIVTFNWGLPQFSSSFRSEFISIPYKTDLDLGLLYFPKLIKQLKPSVFLRCRESIGWRYPVPTITVCHDLNEILWSYQPPRPLLRRIFDYCCQQLRIYALRCSTTVICNSVFVQEQAIKNYKISRHQTKIGYCGVDPRFYRLSIQVNQEQVKEQYGRDGFLLAFATGDYRENFTILPSLIKKVKQLGYPGSLVIAGVDQKANYAQVLIDDLKNHNLQFNQDFYLEPFLGEDQFTHLVELYTAADFYLELSWHEGFGMQLVEAMACGTTCISSHQAALAEVGSSWVIPVNPRDSLQIANTIYQSWKGNLHSRDNTLQIEYTKQNFTWDTVGKIVTSTISPYG